MDKTERIGIGSMCFAGFLQKRRNWCRKEDVQQQQQRRRQGCGCSGGSDGRAASVGFRLIGTGWYQLVTLSLRKVFLLRRCLPKTSKLLLLIPLLLLLLGLWFWGFGGFISLFPSLNWTIIVRTQRTNGFARVREGQADSFQSAQPPKDAVNIFDSGRISKLEKQVAFLSERYRHHREERSKLIHLLRDLQDQIVQMSDKSEVLKLTEDVMGPLLKDLKEKRKRKKAIGRASSEEAVVNFSFSVYNPY
ncbi:SUN domain-containing protein 1-like [Pterocles gutturalis]